MKLRRVTPFFYVYPKAFLDTETVTDFDIEWWSDEVYIWENDEWGGYKDFVSPVSETISHAMGDCDDYAAVAASVEYARGNDVEILFLYKKGWPPHPEHVVAAANGKIYDSGKIWKNTSPEEYLAQTDYDGYISRKV